MFRRKEDSLFDNTTDPNQTDSAESATVITPPASSSSQAAMTSPAQPLGARTMPDTRPTTPQPPTSGFRPATAPIGGDMSRNRMPEPKSSMGSPQGAPAPSERANKSGKRVLTVGNDILLKGEIATCDRLVIEGKVDATLNDVHTVEIAESGSFKGAAQIEDAEISGLFEGDLTVRNRLVIYATGKVRGKITYGEIEIQRGGELTGEIKSSNAQGGANRARKDDKVAA
jgi:cytoskeletal protein CcmA (bactofilin family)